MSKIDNQLRSLKKFPLWIIPAIFSLMLFSLNSLSTSPDVAIYLNAALDIVNNNSINQFSTGVFEQRPLFSIFIALSFWLFGISIRNAFWVTRFFFLLNIMSVFFIGRRLFNKWVGLFASLFLLTSLAYNEWSSYLLIDNVLPFFLLWYFFFTFLGIEKGSIKYFILAALFLMLSLFLQQRTIIFLSFPFFSMICILVFTKNYKTKKALKLLSIIGVVLFIAYILYASIFFLSTGYVHTPLGRSIDLKHIEISKLITDNRFIYHMFIDKNGNFSFFNFVVHIYTFYIRFVSPNFPMLIEFLLLFGWGFTLYKAFRRSKPDILLSIFFLISVFIMAYMGNPILPRRFGDILFLLCFSSLVIGRLIYEIVKIILLTFKKIEFLKPKFISSLLVILIISSVFGAQISQSWDFYRTRASLFTRNWGFTVDSWHNDHVKNMSAWISDNIPEDSKILSSELWGESFYFFTKGKYPLNLLQLSAKRNLAYFFDKDKLLFFDYREDFLNKKFKAIDEEHLLNFLKNTSTQYILITPSANSFLWYLNDNDCFEKLHEIHMYPNPGWMRLYKVLDVKPKIGYQGVINRGMMTWLKNLYQTDKNRFKEIKKRILKKGLGWSDEDVERRIVREIPSHSVNLRLNNKVKFLGYDLAPITQSKFEIMENEESENQNKQDEIATLPSLARNDNELVSFKKTEGKGEKELTQEIPSLKLGEKFELIFYWKCLEKIDHRYTVWAGLNKKYNSIELSHILVDESEYPTTAWRPGEVIKDICQLRVPDYFDPGEYEFTLSLYDINEGKKASPAFGVGNVKILVPLEGAINRAREYSELGFRMKLLNEYTEIIKHINDVSDPENRKLLVQALEELKNYKISDPQNLDVNYALGIGYKKLGNLEKAEEMLKNVLEKNGNHNGALFHLAKIYYLEKKYQLAAELLEKVPLDQENNINASLLLKNIYNKLANSEKLLEVDRKLKIISENHAKKSKWDVRGGKTSDPSLPWANVNIGKKIFLYPDIIKLILKIKGDKTGDVLPHLTVWLDDKLLHEGYLKNEEWNDYEFYIKDIEPGEHLFKIWKRGGGPLYLGELNLIQINALKVTMPSKEAVLYMDEGMDIKWTPSQGSKRS